MFGWFSIEKRRFCRRVTIFGWTMEWRRKRSFTQIEETLRTLEMRFQEAQMPRVEIALNNQRVLEETSHGTAFGEWGIRWCRTLRSLMTVMDVRGRESDFVRIGPDRDGGYVHLNDFPTGCVAYSFGISDDVGWDRDIAQRGIDVFMYDHTISGLPEEHPRFHFFRTGVTGAHPLPDCRTLDELIIVNGHRDCRDLILKMDVEGCEWDVLNHVPEKTLTQFSQMVFEFHGMAGGPYDDVIVPSLEKINRTHQLVHLHANNYGGVRWLGDRFQSVTFEATYVRRADYEFVPSDRFFPADIDRPNNPLLPDILIGNCGKT